MEYSIQDQDDEETFDFLFGGNTSSTNNHQHQEQMFTPSSNHNDTNPPSQPYTLSVLNTSSTSTILSNTSNDLEAQQGSGEDASSSEEVFVGEVIPIDSEQDQTLDNAHNRSSTNGNNDEEITHSDVVIEPGNNKLDDPSDLKQQQQEQQQEQQQQDTEQLHQQQYQNQQHQDLEQYVSPHAVIPDDSPKDVTKKKRRPPPLPPAPKPTPSNDPAPQPPNDEKKSDKNEENKDDTASSSATTQNTGKVGGKDEHSKADHSSSIDEEEMKKSAASAAAITKKRILPPSKEKQAEAQKNLARIRREDENKQILITRLDNLTKKVNDHGDIVREIARRMEQIRADKLFRLQNPRAVSPKAGENIFNLGASLASATKAPPIRRHPDNPQVAKDLSKVNFEKIGWNAPFHCFGLDSATEPNRKCQDADEIFNETIDLQIKYGDKIMDGNFVRDYLRVVILGKQPTPAIYEKIRNIPTNHIDSLLLERSGVSYEDNYFDYPDYAIGKVIRGFPYILNCLAKQLLEDPREYCKLCPSDKIQKKLSQHGSNDKNEFVEEHIAEEEMWKRLQLQMKSDVAEFRNICVLSICRRYPLLVESVATQPRSLNEDIIQKAISSNRILYVVVHLIEEGIVQAYTNILPLFYAQVFLKENTILSESLSILYQLSPLELMQKLDIKECFRLNNLIDEGLVPYSQQIADFEYLFSSSCQHPPLLKLSKLVILLQSLCNEPKRQQDLLIQAIDGADDKKYQGTEKFVVTGDDILPLFIYVVIRSQVSSLPSAIHLLDDFCPSEFKSTGEIGYVMTLLFASLSAIPSLR